MKGGETGGGGKKTRKGNQILLHKNLQKKNLLTRFSNVLLHNTKKEGVGVRGCEGKEQTRRTTTTMTNDDDEDKFKLFYNLKRINFQSFFFSFFLYLFS